MLLKKIYEVDKLMEVSLLFSRSFGEFGKFCDVFHENMFELLKESYKDVNFKVEIRKYFFDIQY